MNNREELAFVPQFEFQIPHFLLNFNQQYLNENDRIAHWVSVTQLQDS